MLSTYVTAAPGCFTCATRPGPLLSRAEPLHPPPSPRPRPHSLRCRTRPSRRCPRSRALQSQRCRRNWCWHSAVQAATPRPMDSMASGCRLHSCRCRLTSPGTLSHITRDEPTAPMYLREATGGAATGAPGRSPACTGTSGGARGGMGKGCGRDRGAKRREGSCLGRGRVWERLLRSAPLDSDFGSAPTFCGENL